MQKFISIGGAIIAILVLIIFFIQADRVIKLLQLLIVAGLFLYYLSTRKNKKQN
jgi:hypothetical protein